MTHGRRGIVMVADADAQVRREVMSDLRKAGYMAVGCTDLVGALTYLALGERLDALVTCTGPAGGHDAMDLVREARAARPRLSIVYVSPSHPGEDRMIPGCGFVLKPFRSGQVTEAVTERLAARQGHTARAA